MLGSSRGCGWNGFLDRVNGVSSKYRQLNIVPRVVEQVSHMGRRAMCSNSAMRRKVRAVSQRRRRKLPA